MRQVDEKIRHTIEAKIRCECYCVPRDEMRSAFIGLPDVWLKMKVKAIADAIGFEQSLDDIDDERISELRHMLEEVQYRNLCCAFALPAACLPQLCIRRPRQWPACVGADGLAGVRFACAGACLLRRVFVPVRWALSTRSKLSLSLA